MDPDDREFMGQLLLRHEKASDAMIARLNQATEESRLRTEQIRADIAEVKRTGGAQTEALGAQAEALRAHTREFVAEMRAQRQALFRVLDRLDAKGA
jgi:ABC-type transporter Mla subunit MlaD